VAMMFNGKVVLAGALDDVKESHHRLVFRFDSPQPSAPKMPGVLSLTGGGLEWTAICNGQRDQAVAAAARAGGRVVAEEVPSLDEIFVAWAGAKSE
jgi:ABC-2 type transport system ATP-binding protein